MTETPGVPEEHQPARWLVVGAAGMLGQDVVAAARAAGHDVTGIGRSDLDITDAATVSDVVAGHDVVVNCAAWTAVDDAETHEAEAFAVNAAGAANLARVTAAAGARLVHVSTDYVFDGRATEPYPEDAPVRPRSAYGRTKAAGEWAVRAEAPDAVVVRTAWLYGAGGRCFPRTIARVAGERDRLSVVDDQTGQPTWTADLAHLIVRLVGAKAPGGIYHGTSSGQVTWFGFAREVVAASGHTTPVDPTTSAAYQLPAPRPAYSVLGHDRLRAVGVEPIGDWAERWKVAAPAVLGLSVGAGQSSSSPSR
ncbi:dTDP-4-dehydrorhamnose reductase [Promicromonospora aerolata]|uniref:dTDP-4-dehydrorhamnose reductase n=1 Tax=Promicromonospora aerolata TaxID=195749 RepID=A0ABW4V5K0_9MICO